MSVDFQGVWDTVVQWLGRFWPGVLSSIIALRWLPAESTRLDRFFAALGGAAAAVNLAPAAAELMGITSVKVEAGVIFMTGLFGMTIAGSLIATIRQLELASFITDVWKKFFRTGG